LLAAMAVAILLPPLKLTIFRSRPCFLKMPSLSPTSTGMMGSAFGAALPTVSVVANDGVQLEAINQPAIAHAASNHLQHNFSCMVSSLLSAPLQGRRLSGFPL